MTAADVAADSRANNRLHDVLIQTLNAEHPATVFGMALGSPQWRKLPLQDDATTTLSAVRVTALSDTSCAITVQLCSGAACDVKVVTYYFPRPLTRTGTTPTPTAIIEDLHNRVCGAELAWITRNPFAWGILLVVSLLAYGQIILGGVEGIRETFVSGHGFRLIEKGIINTLFRGSVTHFAYGVVAAYWFTVVAHALEAGITYYICGPNKLQLRFLPRLKWTLLVFLVGYPIFSRLQPFVDVINAHKHTQQQQQQEQKEQQQQKEQETKKAK